MTKLFITQKNSLDILLGEFAQKSAHTLDVELSHTLAASYDLSHSESLIIRECL